MGLESTPRKTPSSGLPRGTRAIVVGCLLAASLGLAFPHSATAAEVVSFKRNGVARHVSGQLVTEAQDGGVLVMDSEGILWAIQPEEITNRSRDDKPAVRLTREELAARLLEQLPEGFRVHETAHYLLCYNTSRAYAMWCGGLYERLYAAFHTYWKRQGIELSEPPGALVALVFDGPDSYKEYARQELGTAPSMSGYFSLRSNRVTIYDLTQNKSLTTTASVNRLVMQSKAETVATIVHEATHQLAFNCGLHERYADIPLWVSEGTAVFFETPDLKSKRGWRGIGAVHRHRLAAFRQYATSRPADSLHTMLATDDRFRNARTATDAYAEAWAVNYYLLKTRSKEYVRYLNVLAKKRPLLYDTPEERIELFEKSFNQSVEQFDEDMMRTISRLR